MKRSDAASVTLDAPTLVEASAGTGKTYTITTHFVRAVIDDGYTPEQILVVTYTKAATAELRVRVRERIVEALTALEVGASPADALGSTLDEATGRLGRFEVERRLRRALGSMDQAAILTIHGFCQRLLQDYPLSFHIDFDFEVTEDLPALHAELATDFWASDLYEREEWFVRALSDHKVDTKALAALANAATMPGVSVIGPERVEVDDEIVQAVLSHHSEAAQLWSENRDEIARILLEHGGLSRNSYRKKSMPKWIEELTDYFRADGLEAPPEYFSKLAQGRMVMKKGEEEPRHPFFEACRALCEAREALEPMLDYAVFDFKRRFVDFVRRRAELRMRETGALSFDDLLTKVHARIAEGEHARGSELASMIARAYPLALVDEFQDTDSIQYGIFRAIYGDGAALYVGDPKQAIYSFRGADVFSYLAASNDVGERRYTLDTNRRSDPSLVRAVNTLFTRQPSAFLIDGIRFDDAFAHHPEDRSTLSPSMEIIFVDEDRLRGSLVSEVATIVASEVAHLLRSEQRIDQRPIEPEDVAVLCRSNAKAREVTNALRALDVPTALDGDSSVLGTVVAQELRAVLEAALAPGDSRKVRRALLTALLGVSPRALSSMEDEVWTDWVSRFQRWHETWHREGVVRCIEDMLRSADAEQRIARTSAARRDLTDLLHLEELLMRGERERQRDPVALMQWYRRLEQDSAGGGMVRSEDLQQRPDAESGAVHVSTIHKSKGLEYGVVFCPFNWADGALKAADKKALKFHDETGAIRIDLGSKSFDTHLQAAKTEKMSEALRLLYVAVTRAKHRCSLVWARASGFTSSALGYAIHGDSLSRKTTQQQMLEEVEQLAQISGGTIGCRPPRPEAAKMTRRQSGAVLEARRAVRTYDRSARVGSFTSITGHHDEASAARVRIDPERREGRLFSSLPGGTRTGLLLHSILEEADFGALDGDATRQVVERQLRAHGLPASLALDVQRDLVVVATTPLFARHDGPTLERLDPNRQLRELEFTLGSGNSRLEGLGALLRKHGARSYADRLAGLHVKFLQSFLRGYVDLVFEWEGRWYVADYKSNTLPRYDTVELTETVEREHYSLQALLYSAAIQRYLRLRVPGYDAQTSWGGAIFLFLRGMKGPTAPGEGVFVDCFSQDLLESLDAWLGGIDDSR